MIPEVAHFALILSLCVALSQATLPLVGVARGNGAMMAYGRIAAYLQGALIAVAFFGLMWSFFRNDFSVLYVAGHSNSALPLVYRLTAVWGGHEGSILLWVLVLGIWSAAVALFGGKLPPSLLARVLAVMGAIAAGLIAFILFTSNPFERLIPPAPDGRDLNPLLQDPGMVIHPPLLYFGYVGFSVVFAFAVAALLEGRFDAAWARWTRPWTIAAWCFLTLGIALGSYWAYYELGWGGWWFWDPVENASFMPWLVGTALLHSLAVSDRRGELKAWTLLLAILAFALSLLGTFMVRSGVLTSVHAFATDPRRGVFILALLAVVTITAMSLFAWRAPLLVSRRRLSLFSREGLLLIGNVLLLVAAGSVLLGTLYPLILDALGQGKISVGPPYFETVFAPMMVPVMLLAGVGAMARWQSVSPATLTRQVMSPAVLALPVGLALSWLLGAWRPLTFAGYVLCAWVGMTSANQAWQLITEKRRPSLSTIGMLLAHFGLAAFIFGVTTVKSYESVEELRMAVGDTASLSGYSFRLNALDDMQGPNYVTTRADFEVAREGRTWHLFPEKRVYQVQQLPMTESAIDSSLRRDIYVALGEPLADNVWGVRLQVKPYVVWIWLGCLMMAFGGALAAADRRYRRAEGTA
ncbi:MAG TPA: heme lyase CcmF/NrfE family subunit [Rhodocyclaceae bacterium]|nr:heme lyase CcmF/NrfE family subunit [Rhodocyclaceae bacterium]